MTNYPSHWCETCKRYCKKGCAPCAMYIALSDAPEIEQPIGYIEEVKDGEEEAN